MAYTEQQILGASDAFALGIATEAGEKYLGGSFSADANYTLTQVAAKLAKIGTPTGTLTAYVYSNTGGNLPNALLATSTNTVDITTLTTTPTLTAFQFAGVSLTSGTRYWIVLMASAIGDVDNSALWRGASSTEYASYSADASTWSGPFGDGQMTLTTYVTDTISATVTQTLAPVTPAITGTIAVTGSTTQTLASITTALTGTVSISGVVSQTLEAVAPTITGSTGAVASVDQTLADVTPAITGTVAVTADVQQGLADVALSATATVASVILATVNQTLASVSVSATGTVDIHGVLSKTLGTVSIAATATSVEPTIFVLSPSTYISANAATATVGRLTAPANKTVNGDFQSGRISDDTNPLPSLDLITNRYTELEWALTTTSNASIGSTYQFRVTANGATLDTYTVTPTWVFVNQANGIVSQTLASASLTATAEVQSPGSAVVNQTLQSASLVMTGSTGRAAEIAVTLGEMNNPIIHLEPANLAGGDPLGWNFYFGRNTGIYTEIVSYPFPTDYDVPLVEVAPDTGEWYVMAKAYNADGESDPSNELFMVVPTFTATVADASGIGVVTQTLGSVSCAAVAKVAVAGTVVQTLAPVTATIAGTTSLTGSITQTLGAITPTITGTVSVSAEVTQTLDPVTIVSTGTAAFATSEATVDVTLDSVACNATASVYDTGSNTAWVDALLESVQCNMVGDVDIVGIVDETLEVIGTTITAHLGYRAFAKRNVLLDGSEMRCS